MQLRPRLTLGFWALGVLLVAGFHTIEHFVQLYQKYQLHSSHAHGLLGAYFDSDPIHFAFNWALFFALAPLLRTGAVQGYAGARPSWRLFLAGFGLQAFHAVEHTIKMSQYWAGVQPAPGTLGYFFPLIPAHTWLNALVYALVAPQLWLLSKQWAQQQGLPWVGRPAATQS